MDKYDHNAHSVFLLYYHLILVVKYRRKVFDIMRIQSSSCTTTSSWS